MGDFRMGMSSLDALCAFAEEGARVYSLNNLHAKIYVFDESTALVTSANVTQAGLRSNLECGLATSEAYRRLKKPDSRRRSSRGKITLTAKKEVVA